MDRLPRCRRDKRDGSPGRQLCLVKFFFSSPPANISVASAKGAGTEGKAGVVRVRRRADAEQTRRQRGGRVKGGSVKFGKGNTSGVGDGQVGAGRVTDERRVNGATRCFLLACIPACSSFLITDTSHNIYPCEV